ncbi:hypothetical protein LRP50_06170 [Enterovibrio sp. ZSDZ42]|uniref:Chitin-binding type-3 domain-containing protein n=1 Tax=Enterovibrio gelatinilyticus TaxID=2899819 RepID=A0ABT5QXR3_9GAMM|nr:hypothetical protein [Enterovibrio sp. ZSDZ42]MDD1792705.1 hypothetical protein [Enterovibrio sp. ZSDZ42]
MKLRLLALSLLLSGSLSAAELYNPAKNYTVGEQVSFNGNIYEAQWWANAGQSPAGITQNSWDSPWVWVSESSDDMTPPAGDIISTDLQYFERGHTINSDTLGLSNLTISAIERYQDRLYVTHDTSPGVVLILDARTGAALGQIDGIPNGSGISTYNRVNELYIDNNLLYVASLSSNRVDIFDLDNAHQHVMSLGTGKFSGTNSLLHPQSVMTNTDYVFVSDASDNIKVYRQQDVTPNNHYRTPQYAYLQFEGKYSNRKVQMHQLGDFLLVATENRNYFVYDLRKLEEAAASGTRLIAEKRIASKVLKIDKDGDQLIVNQNGRVEWHNIENVIANGFEFTQPTRVLSKLHETAIGNLKDLHFSDDELITATPNEVRFDLLRTNTVTFAPNDLVETTQLTFEELAPFSITEILTNDEPHHILTDRTLRSVKVNSPVKTAFVDRDTIQITNYAALELSDLTLEVKLEGTDHWVVLATLDRIPAYAQITLPLSAFGTGQFNTADNGGSVDLETVFTSSQPYETLFDYRFNSQSDAFAQKLAAMKPTWDIRFAPNNDAKWREMNALYAREWLIILTNLAYMVSQDEFEHLWFNFESIFGHNMNGPAGKVDGPNGYFTAEDYQYYFDTLMVRPNVNAGITSIGGGLGGTGITGVDTWMFYTHYYGTWGIIAHEFGHGFDGRGPGYSHNTSFAQGGNGWQLLMTQLANYHIRKGDLPYMDDNTNGFYQSENAAYHHVAVDTGKRKHRAASHMYPVENYFMMQSDMPQGWIQNGADMNINALDKLDFLERAHVAKYSMGNDTPYLCRFTFEDGQQYFGSVTQHGDDTRCDAGKDISYRRADGSKVPLQSALNAFDWLSIHNPALSGEAVMHENGQPLCQVNRSGFYGTGFVNTGGQCVQLPNVYWSNGNRWVFSSSWTPLKYSDSWTAPSSRSFALDFIDEAYNHESCGSIH